MIIKNNLLKTLVYLILIVFIIGVFSCSQKKRQANDIVIEWMQKEVIIPKNILYKTITKDTANISIFKTQFKILVSIDSVGCSACKLKLNQWKEYVDYCKLNLYDVSFLFVISKRKDIEFEHRLILENFTYPIIFDPKDEFGKLNKFPKNDEFRTFLLNDKNRVVLIGSPIKNNNIRKMYDEIFRAEKRASIKQLNDFDNTSFKCKTTLLKLISDSIHIKRIAINTTKNFMFHIKNIGENTLEINGINTSCGCTVAKYDKKPIHQGESTTIVLKYKPNALGYFHKTADVVCNVPKGSVRLTITGEVVE
jgi:hypothetical protein